MPRDAEIQCRVSRALLRTFVDRAARERGDRHLQAARIHVESLLSSTAASKTIRLSGSPDGFISILQFVARDVARDFRARRPAALSPLSQLLTPIVSRHEFPPRVEPKFSREYSLCFDF
jgi:hypothetical protein